MRLIWSFALALLLAPAALAQPFFFGDPVPLTDTRYGSFSGEPRLVSNGRDAFLAWASGGTLRFTRVTDGERRVGHPVFDVDNDWYDVVWTGLHFLAVGYHRTGSEEILQGRLIDFNGEPFGPTFEITNLYARPRLAWDGRYVLLTYLEGDTYIGSARLTREGQLLDEIPRSFVLRPEVRDTGVSGYAPGFITVTAYNDVISFATVSQSGDWGNSVPIAVTAYPQREVTIATTPEREVLAVWTSPNGTLDAAIIRNNGTLLQRFSLESTTGATTVSTAWDGTRWVVAYVAAGKAHVRRYERAGGAEERLVGLDAAAGSPVTVASASGKTFVAWRGTSVGNPILVRNLANGSASDLAAFGAAEQTLYDAAAANNGVLTVWSELRDGRRTLHAGVRAADGSWRETVVGTTEDAAFAASDGTGFVIVRKKGTAWEATLLDGQGRIMNVSPGATNFAPTGVAWNGAAYVVIGQDTDGVIVGSLLQPSGLSTPVRTLVLPRPNREIENPRVAARTGEALIVWQDTEEIVCFPICNAYDTLVHGARFNATLDRIDATPFSIAPDDARYPDAVWDGTRYVIAWSDSETQSVQYRTLRSNGAISGTTALPLSNGGETRVSVIDGGVSIVNESGDAALLYLGNTVALPDLGQLGPRDALVPVDGTLAYFTTSRRTDVPYHGATRLQMRIGDLFAPAVKPGAPAITRAELPPGAAAMTIEWSAAAGEVTGYRVEYRVDHGSWNELDEWFEPNNRALTIRPWRTVPAVYQFRVRAWSESGLGAYSEPATVKMQSLRQRATRR
jgi:hypothetical protein